MHNRGPVSSVGIATYYELDSLGIESRWGEVFRTRPDRFWGPRSLMYNGYWVFLWVNRPGRGADHPLSPCRHLVNKTELDWTELYSVDVCER
jgi:hypothetical protein